MTTVLSTTEEDEFENIGPPLTTLSAIERCARGQEPRSFIVMCANEEVHIAGPSWSWMSAFPAKKRHNTPWPCYTLAEIRRMAERKLPGVDHDHIGIWARFFDSIPGYRPVFEAIPCA